MSATETFSPITRWLSTTGRRLTGTVSDGVARVRLLDVNHPRGVMTINAEAPTIEEAMSKALDLAFIKEHS